MVVIHDAVLDRTADAATRPGFGPGVRVRDREFAQLRQLDAACWPSRRWQGFRPVPIPTLEEALVEIVVQGGCQCVIERKPNDATAEPLCELIRRLGVAERVVITSYAAEPDAWDFLNQCLDILGNVRVAYQLAGDSYRPLGSARTGQFADCEHTMLSRELVLTLQRHGLQVFAWTANEPKDICRLARIGVEGITTDYAARALAALASMGEAEPSAPEDPARP